MFFEPEDDTKVVFTDNALEFVKACEDSFLEPMFVDTTSIRDYQYFRKQSKNAERRHFYCSRTVRIG